MVYWTRQRAGEREEQRQTLQHALRAQHGALSSAEAHAPAFQVPETPVVAPERLRRPAPATAVPLYN